jgi:hypothetical protein
VPTVKFVRKKRVYLKKGSHIYPFIWIEFLEDASFSMGLMSKQIKLTEYGSAIQRGLQFREHTEVLTRGTIPINETKMPHFTFHPPRFSQTSGIVHMVDKCGKVDEYEFNWFPVTMVDHIATVYSGDISLLGNVKSPKRNYSLVAVPRSSQGMRMDVFICPVGAHVELDPLSEDNVIGGCKHYNLICSFYSDNSPKFAIYVATEMREQKTF